MPFSPNLELHAVRYPVILLLLLAISGCDSLTGPDTPAGAIPFDPPPPYAAYWDRVETDSGRSRDFGGIRWVEVPGGPWSVEGDQVRAMWVQRGRRIYIASEHLGDAPLIMHEMLHDVLNGDPEHTNPLFATDAYTSRNTYIR